MLRLSEVTVHSAANHSLWHRTIQFSGVNILPSGHMTVFVPFSKTDQLSRGQTIEILPVDGNLCPIKSMKKLFSVCPKHAGPLFIHSNTSPLTRVQFTRVLHKLCKLAGIHEHIKTHSFRIGGATFCASLQMPEERILELGRWKSNCYKRYIRFPSMPLD